MYHVPVTVESGREVRSNMLFSVINASCLQAQWGCTSPLSPCFNTRVDTLLLGSSLSKFVRVFRSFQNRHGCHLYLPKPNRRERETSRPLEVFAHFLNAEQTDKICLSQTIHVWYSSLVYIYHKKQQNVGKYATHCSSLRILVPDHEFCGVKMGSSNFI